MTHKIVPISEIPKDIIDTPIDSLMDLYKVCQKMEYICTVEKGIGLAAVQIGIPWKLFVYNRDGEFHYMVNCEYKPIGEEKAVSIEGCLSLRNNDGDFRRYKLDRFCKIRVTGKRLIVGDDLRLEEVDFTEEDNIYCVVCQHEIDHHRGILISDVGEEISLMG